MDDDLIDQPTVNKSNEAIQRRAVERGAGVAFVVKGLRDQYPSKGTLRFHIRAADIALDPARREIVRCLHRLAGVDGGPDRPTGEGPRMMNRQMKPRRGTDRAQP